MLAPLRRSPCGALATMASLIFVRTVKLCTVPCCASHGELSASTRPKSRGRSLTTTQNSEPRPQSVWMRCQPVSSPSSKLASAGAVIELRTEKLVQSWKLKSNSVVFPGTPTAFTFTTSSGERLTASTSARSEGRRSLPDRAPPPGAQSARPLCRPSCRGTRRRSRAPTRAAPSGPMPRRRRGERVARGRRARRRCQSSRLAFEDPDDLAPREIERVGDACGVEVHQLFGVLVDARRDLDDARDFDVDHEGDRPWPARRALVLGGRLAVEQDAELALHLAAARLGEEPAAGVRCRGRGVDHALDGPAVRAHDGAEVSDGAARREEQALDLGGELGEREPRVRDAVALQSERGLLGDLE